MSAHQLVVNGPRNIGKRESAFLFGDRGMKLHLIQQVAKFFNKRIIGSWIFGIKFIDGVNYFICLFKQVLDE